MVSKEITEKILQITNLVITQKSLLLIDTIIRGTDKNIVIEIFVDSKIGVDADLCAEVSDMIKSRIEEELEIENYRLDVSSPGIDRPLKYLDQYYKHIGRKFYILYEKDGNTFELNNVELTGIENDILTFKNNKLQLQINFNNIKKAITIISF